MSIMVGRIMSLESALSQITDRLREDEYPNEQAISQGVVLRVLEELGWDTYDTAVVWPEYQTGGGRADFALCNPPTRPAIFIEVKKPGGAEGAVQQALQYAFHSGVRFVVLTDGTTWSFYLPGEAGDYDERRVYKLDLYERSLSEATETFRRYLMRDNVVSGKSLEAALAEYRNRSRRSQANAAIPGAWHELVGNRDELLLEILADAVESKVGFRPEDGDVFAFLGGSVAGGATAPAAAPLKPSSSPPRRKTKAPSRKPAPEQPTGTGEQPVTPRRLPQGASKLLVIGGKEYPYRNAKDAMIIVLQTLADSDPAFLGRLAQHPGLHGRTRRYIGRTPEDLYPDQEHLRKHHAKLPDGWLVTTNLNNDTKKKIIQVAADVAGMSLQEDISLPF